MPAAPGSESVLSVDEPPLVRTPPPGPSSRAWSARLSRVESPAFAARRDARAERTGDEQAPIVYAQASGANVLDVDGNRYVDLTAGFGALALGHGCPLVTRPVDRQARRLWHALGDVYPSDAKIGLMERLAQVYGDGARAVGSSDTDARVLLGQSGADAVTAALKTCALATGRPGVVAFDGGYHGLSYGPLSVTSFQPSFREPFAAQLSPHARFVPFPRGDADAAASLAALDTALSTGAVGAVIFEPIQGRAGVRIAPPGFWAEVAARARQHGALLVADEIWTGLGRAGALTLSAELGVAPDVLCLGKALGGGLPLSACVGRDGVMAAWAEHGEVVHTATFHGSPIACAGGSALLDALRSERLAARALDVGARWLAELRGALASAPELVEVRGRGLLIGVELSSGELGLSMVRRLLAEGYLVVPGGRRAEVLTLTPPLTISEARLSEFTATLGSLLASLRDHVE
ncbi:MAG: aspartate aminotransferase family protein [Polyangiaceae bacterium]|nr:aspartate aminotransferase family protein [Polyangiaceae bacterium]